MGNYAFARGSYSTEGTMDGQATSNSGGWMSYGEMIDGEWKLHGLVSGIGDGQSAPGFQMGEMPASNESAAMAAEGAEYFVTHFNAGHAEMVGSRYAEDVILINSPENGRAALVANLQAMIDQGAQVTVTPFAAVEHGDYMSSIGTYTMTVDGQTATGHYGNVSMANADGTQSVIWSLATTHPTGM